MTQEKCLGFDIKRNQESQYLRKKPFPLHCLSKILNVNRVMLANRLVPFAKGQLKVLVNFKRLKFTKAIDADTILLEVDVT